MVFGALGKLRAVVKFKDSGTNMAEESHSIPNCKW